jgi:hypothetical protein
MESMGNDAMIGTSKMVGPVIGRLLRVGFSRGITRGGDFSKKQTSFDMITFLNPGS